MSPANLFPDPGSLQRGAITYFPVVPARLEFAVEVRRAILRDRPEVVAVELPVTLERHYLEAVRRLPEISVLVYPEAGDSDTAVYVPIEPADPFTEAVRTATEIGAQVLFIEPDFQDRPHIPDSYPDTYALRQIPLDRYIEAYRLHPSYRTDEIDRHAAGIAWKLQGADPERRTLAVISLNLLDAVLDAMEVPQDEPEARERSRDVDLINAHPSCLIEIMAEYPYFQERYERYRSIAGSFIEPDPALIDRPRTQFALLKEAEERYALNTGDRVLFWQRRLIARYTRNLALIDNALTASLFDIVAAARSIVDDNYAWEVWDLAGRYPAQQDHSALETLNISGDQVWFRTKRMKIRRRLPRAKQILPPRGMKMRKKEIRPGEWAEQIDGSSICSYPPEDLVIEDYGNFLKHKAKSILSSERNRVEPFTTSFLDGLDIRETIRQWHSGKLFVKNLERIQGEVGAVAVIFDPDPDNRYRYLTTWLGEHQNESDMAFYSTDPFEHIVGPGIGRGEYGGFLMTRPPRRMYDVWSDPDYELAESKPERLLLAALDYSIERYVVYVAARPPRSVFRSIAAHLGRKIVYVPIGQLSSPRLKRLRVVHVLDSHARRKSAKDYIW